MLDLIKRTYLKHGLQSEIKELYLSITLRAFAISMIAIFEPIYLYKVFGSIQIIFIYYVCFHILYFFTIPLGAKAAAKYGFEHCIFYSTPFLILYYLCLSLLEVSPFFLIFNIFFAVGELTLFRPAYHANMAHYGSVGFRGREVGFMFFLQTIAAVVGPLVGGILITFFNFKFVFVLASFLALISAAPMLSTKENFTPSYFSYRKAFKNFIFPKGRYKRGDSLAYAGYGEAAIVDYGWPIFMSLFLAGLHIVGFVTSVALFLSAILKLYFGKLSDKFKDTKKRKWVAYNTTILSFVDFCRPFITNWFGIISVSFLYGAVKSGIIYSFFTYVYSAAGKNSSFLKYAVFYEMSLVFGKIVMGSILVLTSFFLTGTNFWIAAFVIAGLWSYLFILLKFNKK